MEKSLKFSGTANPKLQYKINTSIIFNFLREKEPISRAEISRGLNISAPAVSRVISNLIKLGYVVETEKKKTKGGKRPTLLKTNQGKFYVIGIDLGKERISIALSDLSKKIIKKYSGIAITGKLDIEKSIIRELKKFLDSKKGLIPKNINRGKIKGICIGMPAAVDSSTGKVTAVPHYENWLEINLKKIIQKEFGVPVFIENDVNLSCLAEKNFGESKNYHNSVYLGISNGVGAGIIIGDHIIRGFNGSAGEIAYTIMDKEIIGDIDDENRFLERFVSLENIKTRAISAKEDEAMLRDLIGDAKEQDISLSIVFEAAKKGNSYSQDIIKDMTNATAMGIINLILILNPEIIVIGGDICNISHKEELFLRPIIDKISKAIPIEIPKIIFSTLGEDAGIIGAAHMAVESLFLKEYPYKLE